MHPILPGAATGVLGSGQPGRMFAIAAREQDTPTGQTQQRVREKTFLPRVGRPVVPCRVIRLTDLRSALAGLGCPAVLKTASFGNDGKGQVRIDRIEEADVNWSSLATAKPCSRPSSILNARCR